MANPLSESSSLPQFSSRVALSLPLPQLLYSDNVRQRTTTTKTASTSQVLGYELLTWPDFRAWVIQVVARLGIGVDPGLDLSPRINPPSFQENFLVGNEGGIVGRFVQNVCVVVNEVNQALPPMYLNQRIQFADSQVGYSAIYPHPQRPASGGVRNLPDLVMVQWGPASASAINILAAVGELKAPWSYSVLAADPAGLLGDARQRYWNKLLKKLHQLFSYMENARLRYGFFSTYEATCFVFREGNKRYQVSPPIHWNDAGEQPTVRMCFVAFATLIANDQFRWYREPSSPTTYANVHTQDGHASSRPPPPPPRDGQSHSKPGASTTTPGAGSGAMQESDAVFASPLSTWSENSSDNGKSTAGIVKSLLAAHNGSGFDLFLSDSCPEISATFTVSEIYSTSNCKFVVAGWVSAPSSEPPLPAWVGEIVVAKIRLRDHAGESWQTHNHEVAMLKKASAVDASLFQSFLATAHLYLFGTKLPVMITKHIPYPALVHAPCWDRPAVLKAVETAMVALNKVGLYHTDLAPRNVLYDVETKRVWVIDMEDVEVLKAPYSREELQVLLGWEMDEF